MLVRGGEVVETEEEGVGVKWFNGLEECVIKSGRALYIVCEICD